MNEIKDIRKHLNKAKEIFDNWKIDEITAFEQSKFDHGIRVCKSILKFINHEIKIGK